MTAKHTQSKIRIRTYSHLLVPREHDMKTTSEVRFYLQEMDKISRTFVPRATACHITHPTLSIPRPRQYHQILREE